MGSEPQSEETYEKLKVYPTIITLKSDAKDVRKYVKDLYDVSTTPP